MPYLLADKGLGVCCRGDKLDHLHVRIAVAVGSTPVLKIALPSSPLPELPESHWSRNLEDGDTYIQLVCQPDTIGATHNHVPSCG